MQTTLHRSGVTLAMVLLADCDPKPESPRAPNVTSTKAKSTGQPTDRRPNMKNHRGIINPE